MWQFTLFLALVKLNSGELQPHICCEIIRWSPGPPLVFIFLIFSLLWDRDQDLQTSPHNRQYFEIHHHQVNWKQVTGAWSEARHILTIFSWKWTNLSCSHCSTLSSLFSLLFSQSVLCSYFPPHEWASHQQWTIINSWFSFKFPVERGILPCLGLRNVCYKFPTVTVWWDQWWYDYTHWSRLSLREQLTLTASPSPDLSRFTVLDHTTAIPPLDSEQPRPSTK